MTPRMRALALLVLCCAALTGCMDECTSVSLREPLSLIKAEDVVQVAISASDRKLFAYRQEPGDSFRIVFARKDYSPVEHCLSGPGFTRLIEASASFRVVRRVSSLVKEVSSDLVIIELWDGSRRTGVEHRLRRPTAEDGRTLMQWCYKQYVVAFDPVVWDGLKAGCASLGAFAPGGG